MLSPSVTQVRGQTAPAVIPLVMEPESKLYTDPVLVLDFQVGHFLSFIFSFFFFFFPFRKGRRGGLETIQW